MADNEHYAALRHQEINLDLNAGSSLAAAVMMYIASLTTAVVAVGYQAAGDADTAMYAAGFAFLSAIASSLCGRSYDNDVIQLEQVRTEIQELEPEKQGLEAKL
ncbi:MAG: hypothetical protein KJ955_03440 [Nanoarchaeota archaeon]|nr:hypothetical protein [Nanoarchaeota archaeon]